MRRGSSGHQVPPTVQTQSIRPMNTGLCVTPMWDKCHRDQNITRSPGKFVCPTQGTFPLKGDPFLVPMVGKFSKKQKRRTTLLINIWLKAPKSKIASIPPISFPGEGLKNMSLVPVKEVIVKLPTVSRKTTPDDVLSQIETTVFAETTESGYLMVK